MGRGFHRFQRAREPIEARFDSAWPSRRSTNYTRICDARRVRAREEEAANGFEYGYTDMITQGITYSRMSKQTGRGRGDGFVARPGTKTRRVRTRAGTPVHNTHTFRGRDEGITRRRSNE